MSNDEKLVMLARGEIVTGTLEEVKALHQWNGDRKMRSKPLGGGRWEAWLEVCDVDALASTPDRHIPAVLATKKSAS